MTTRDEIRAQFALMAKLAADYSALDDKALDAELALEGKSIVKCLRAINGPWYKIQTAARKLAKTSETEQALQAALAELAALKAAQPKAE